VVQFAPLPSGDRNYDGTESGARAQPSPRTQKFLYTWELVFGPSRRVMVDKQR
jgi:hypothetical protein